MADALPPVLVNDDTLDTEAVPFDPPAGSAFTFGDVLSADYVGAPEPWVWRLLYRGAVSCVSGEPGLGKSWLAVAAVLHVLARGGSAVVIDYEDSVRTWAVRLRALMGTAGVSEEQLASVLYLRGGGAPTDEDLTWLPRLVGAAEDVLVVIDSVSEVLAAWGLDENAAGDVTLFHQRLARPLADAGGTVLLLDHVTKDAGGRGRWARGSGAKLAAVTGVAYSLTVDEAFSRERSGVGSLTVSKDRHGAIGPVGASVASLRFVVAGGGLVDIAVDRTTSAAHGDPGPRRIVRDHDPEAAW